MADRPILFSAPMVRALIDGRKTMTRRVLKPQPEELRPGYWHVGDAGGGFCFEGDATRAAVEAAHFAPFDVGDRLWVRETWTDEHVADGEVAYRADGEPPPHVLASGSFRWRPSIYMPRWASRLTLVVTGVRVERLHDISEDDARAEGLVRLNKDGENVHKWGIPDRRGSPKLIGGGAPWHMWCIGHRPAFAQLWDSIHGPGAWATNPWVAAISFDAHRCNIDAMEAAGG